jgi:cytochrome d ubiquinol oxidase subunit I
VNRLFKVVEMVSPTLLDVSRWQFAITIVFHMTFPAITIGLSVFLTVVYGLHLRAGQVNYLQIFRFWKRIFAVGSGWGLSAEP